MKRGLAIGCGGTVGGAWSLGALASVAREWDWDPRTAEVIVGTSSGSTLAALLGAGFAIDELLAAGQGSPDSPPALRELLASPPPALPRVPWGAPPTSLIAVGARRRSPHLALSGLALRGRTDSGFLDGPLTQLLPKGWVEHSATWIIAVDAVDGERVAFGSPGAPSASIRDAVRASWAVPAWFAPKRIGGAEYLDGGVSSTASVDLLAGLDLDELLLVAPMASPRGVRPPGLAGLMEGALRRPMSRRLDREVAMLEAAGTRVVRRHPTNAELAAMGANFMLPSRRLPALEAALATPPLPAPAVGSSTHA